MPLSGLYLDRAGHTGGVPGGEGAAAMFILSIITLFLFFFVTVSYTTKTIFCEMMMCQTCGAVYSDDSVYCLKDGSELIAVHSIKE